MELFAGCLALSVLALALTFVAALFQDDFALRIAAILIARMKARGAYRAKYTAALRDLEAEFGLPEMRWSPARKAEEME